MSLVELSVNRISYSQSQNGAYALILEEIEGERKLPIVIGGFEAQSIAIALDKEIQPPRPLTHDLFKNLANNYEIKVKQVIIHKLVDGIFFSSIICERDNEEEIFDARTSDAIALAVRFKCPIYTHEFILASAGIILDETQEGEDELSKELDAIDDELESIVIDEPKSLSYDDLTIEELNKRLQDAIESENYEEASKIKGELDKRNAN